MKLNSPADLDGKTYGGFGAAYEGPEMKQIIKNAGGKGDFNYDGVPGFGYEPVG